MKLIKHIWGGIVVVLFSAVVVSTAFDISRNAQLIAQFDNNVTQGSSPSLLIY